MGFRSREGGPGCGAGRVGGALCSGCHSVDAWPVAAWGPLLHRSLRWALQGACWGSGAGPRSPLLAVPFLPQGHSCWEALPALPGLCSCESCCFFSFSLFSLCLFSLCDFDQPGCPVSCWVPTSLHAPAACDQARLSARPPSRGPWGAPPPRWPPRPSRTTASPGGHPTRAPRQLPAGVGVASGGLSGAVPWSPGSTSPYAPGPEGKEDGGPLWVGVLLSGHRGLQKSGSLLLRVL